MSKPVPSMDAWLREAKAHPSAPKIGMYLTHNGIVRETAKAQVRNGEKNTLITDGGFRVTLPRKFVTLNSVAKDGFPFFFTAATIGTIFPTPTVFAPFLKSLLSLR